MKIEKPNSKEIHYPSKKLMTTLALGMALSSTACTSTNTPETPHTTPQQQVEVPEVLGGIPPIKPPSQENTTPTASCDINTSKSNQIKHPTALAGKIAVPRK
jgi:hypothetical protein